MQGGKSEDIQLFWDSTLQDRARQAPMFTTRRDCALRHGHGAGSSSQVFASDNERNPLDAVMSHLRTLSSQGGGGVPFASVSRAFGLRGGHSAQAMKESKTGVEFPETYCHLSRKDCPALMGVG